MLDFPLSPADAQVYRPGGDIPNFIYRSVDGTWIRKSGTAQEKNRIVNPSMNVSQQNVNTAGSTNGYYMADQWSLQQTITGAAVSVQRALIDGRQAIRMTVTTANAAAPAAADRVRMSQPVEHNKIADFVWNQATPGRSAVLRFSYYGRAGTYPVAIYNYNGNRSFVMPYTVPVANVWTDFSFSVPPPPVGGTWPVGTNATLYVGFPFSVGATYQAPAAGWNNGLYLGLPGMTLGMDTLGATYAITNVGLYLDANDTGVAPQFQSNTPDQDITECQRYWYRMYHLRGVVTAATTIRCGGMHPVPLRISSPAYAVVGAMRGYDFAAAPALSSVARTAAYNGDDTEFYGDMTTATGLTVGRPGAMITDSVDIYVAVDARM